MFIIIIKNSCIWLHLTPSSNTASIIGKLVSVSRDYYSSREAWASSCSLIDDRWPRECRYEPAYRSERTQHNATRRNARRCNARRRDTTASHFEWRHGDRRFGHTNVYAYLSLISAEPSIANKIRVQLNLKLVYLSSRPRCFSFLAP